ncbi:MAG: hypothetical protein OEN55_17345 [Alphaproteobacteria bacterium]|nr:hypothetical protein [Alphaproteobacteria bacterium]
MRRYLRLPGQRQGSGASTMFAAMVAAIAVAAALHPATLLATEYEERVALSGQYQDQQFVAGEEVRIEAEVADDIFAAGREVVFDGASADKVFAAAQDVLVDGASVETLVAAGSSLTVRATTVEDVILAGRKIDFTGQVADDFVAAGGWLNLRRGADIGDDARLAGREIDIAADIGGDLHAVAQAVTLSGRIGGDVRIEAERIVLLSGARIGGDLAYAGPRKPVLMEGAVVAGEIREFESTLAGFEGGPEDWIGSAILAALGILLALLLLGAVLQLALPGLLSRAAATAREQPWSTLGRGLVLLLLTPIVVMILMMTGIGIPVGMVILASFFVVATVALTAIAYCIGIYLRGLFGRKGAAENTGPRILWTALGISLLAIVGIVPFLGAVAILLALIAGLGAVIRELWRMFHPEPAGAN